MELRDLPSVDALVRRLGATPLPRRLVIDLARAAVDTSRRRIEEGAEAMDPAAILADATRRLLLARPTSLVNATGVLLHTNVGRAPLWEPAADAAREAAVAYGNLELRLEEGTRGGRGAYAEAVLQTLTGAEAALIVNNNAGGVFLTLAALAAGGEVPVSRGELIEIGGSYRLPELMAATGARLREVGTTNRTRASDYAAAGSESTTLLLKVHPSNYRITGFAQEATTAELAAVSADLGVPLAFDVGSGLVDTDAPWLDGPPPAWLRDEPGVIQALAAGADLVLFSGDKLFGGPQAGIVVGDADLISRLRRHPAARALRVDGPTLAAVAVTAEAYANGEAAALPVWRMACLTYEELEGRARRVLSEAGVTGSVEAGLSTVGAGSVPGSEIPSPVVVVRDGDPDGTFLALLAGDPAVLARRGDGSIVLDLRTVPPLLDGHLAEALHRACRS